MLMAGTSVKWSRASEQLNRFIRRPTSPPTPTAWGAAASRRTSPEFLNRSRRDALKQIDCIVLAGTLLDFRMRFGQTIPPTRRSSSSRWTRR